MKCFLDMDGVIADFDAGVLKLHGVISPWTKPENLGKWGTEEMFGVPKADFWYPMGEQFWSGLPWTKEGKDILGLVESVFGFHNISLLTTPCQTEGSVSGKIKWINTHIPRYNTKFLIGFQKHFCANENTILIDDSDKNVDNFRLHGGNALLVPRPWNSNYAKEPVLLHTLTTALYEDKEGVLSKPQQK